MTFGMISADDIREMAVALLNRNSLMARALVQEALRGNPDVHDWPEPSSDDLQVRAIAASVVELLAARAGQKAPLWSEHVESLDSPMYLLAEAATMPSVRHLCDTEAPPQLRKRGFLAPPNFLTFA